MALNPSVVTVGPLTHIRITVTQSDREGGGGVSFHNEEEGEEGEKCEWRAPTMDYGLRL